MSNKNFVTFGEFKDGLTNLKRNLGDLADRIDSINDILDIHKDVVNANSDNCKELEQTVIGLSKRIERLERVTRSVMAAQQNQHSNTAIAAIGLLLGFTSFAGFLVVASDLDKLARKVEALEKARKTSAYSEPYMSYTYVNTDGTAQTSAEKKEEE